MNTLDCLIYISRATLAPVENRSQLNDIVEVSAYRNAEAGITGILTLQNGYFIQLLEGAPSALDLLMLHLHFDKRHKDIHIVARETIARKDITGWSMIGPAPSVPPHPLIDAMLTRPPSSVRPWREALIEMAGVPA